MAKQKTADSIMLERPQKKVPTCVVIDGKATQDNYDTVIMVKEIQARKQWPSLLYTARQLIAAGYKVLGKAKK